MAIERTSILLLFLGVATLFLAVEAARPGTVTVGPIAIRPQALLDVCAKAYYPDLCLKSVKHKSDPFRAARSNINRTVQTARQAKVIATQNSNPKNKNLIDGCIQFFDDTIDDLVEGSAFLQKHDIASLQSYLSSALSNSGSCKDQFDEMPNIPFPPALSEICTTISHMTSNTLGISDLLLQPVMG